MRKFIPTLAAALVVGIAGVAGAAGTKSYTTKGAWSFWSAPGLHPPKLRTDMRTVTGKLAPGYFMLANFKDLVLSEPMVGQGGPLIVDRNLQPVWFKPVKLIVTKSGKTQIGRNATTNLREQTYKGKPVLSWWQGSITNAGTTLKGTDMVVDQHYKPVATLTAQGSGGCPGTSGWVISEHEFLIRGHEAWVTAYRNVPNMNLTKYGGPANGTVIDTSVQKYDLSTGKPLFCWDALQHISLSQSHTKPINGLWDAYHENSISPGNGAFLVSMRSEWTAYQVNESTNKIMWTISGDPKLSTFKLPANARFQWQHDVQLHPGNLLSVFDDHCCNVTGPGKLASPTGSARGLVLKLNFSKHTAALAHVYSHGNNFFVPFLGNTQLIPGGNALVGWGTGFVTSAHGGSVNVFTEYTNGGARVLDARIPNPDLSYRTYLQRWVGLPLYPPSGVVRKANGKTIVYASWNGATRVAAWRVLAGSSKTHLSTAVSHATKTGFETGIVVSGSHKWFEVQALSSKGQVLSTSKVFGFSSPALVGGY